MMSVFAQQGVCVRKECGVCVCKAPQHQANVYSKGGSLSIFPFKVIDATKCACSTPTDFDMRGAHSYFPVCSCTESGRHDES